MKKAIRNYAGAERIAEMILSDTSRSFKYDFYNGLFTHSRKIRYNGTDVLCEVMRENEVLSSEFFDSEFLASFLFRDRKEINGCISNMQLENFTI